MPLLVGKGPDAVPGSKNLFMQFSSVWFIVLCILLCISTETAGQTDTNAIGMEFVRIEPGSFVAGKFQPVYPAPQTRSTGNDERFLLAKKQAEQDASPGFRVAITKPFYIGKFEVTQEQWTKIMGRNPSVFKGSRHPVENISWEDAQAFITRLNETDKQGRRYRLPTEFEWEYAARAGAVDDISWAEIRLSAQLGLKQTAQVGQKKPNGWGIYDMLGNVWEWVSDRYNGKLFPDSVQQRFCKEHVLKGASFVGDVKNATYMTHAAGPGNGWDVGFRIIMEMEDRTPAITLPEGFYPLFNGRDLAGWHISRTSHQGTTPDVLVEDGAIVLRQHPYGQGGILLSDQRFGDFELYLEVKIDSFCNGGIFLRSTESGQAYQIELSEPGGTGDLLGEMLHVSKTVKVSERERFWKPGEWNAFRIRMEGPAPRITLWINGKKAWEVQEPVNDAVANATKGMIGLQAHWSAVFSPAAEAFDMSGSWRPGGVHRFRNIGIKELSRPGR